MITSPNPSDREHVRLRPSMYIGDLTSRGLHHMLYEVIDYANFREAKHVELTLRADGSATVKDDGEGRNADRLVRCLTDLRYERHYENGGLHGVGIVVINFLSGFCNVESMAGGSIFRQSYQQGRSLGDVKRIGKSDVDGMTFSFLPDKEIFCPDEYPNRTCEFEYDIAKKRLLDLSFLRTQVRFSIVDERIGKSESFYSENGASDFVAKANEGFEPIHSDVIRLNGKEHQVGYDIAFQYCKGIRENIVSYANETGTAEGGTHLRAFKSGLIQVLNRLGLEQSYFENEIVDPDAFFEGLTCVIMVRVDGAVFEGATKTKLANVEVVHVIECALKQFLERYFATHPTTAASILNKIAQSAKMRNRFPPVVHRIGREQRRLMLPEELPSKHGVTARFPSSYVNRMRKRNGGEIRIEGEVWLLFQFRHPPGELRSVEVETDVIERTLLARERPGVPDDSLVVAENSQGDLLLFVRLDESPRGAEFPSPYGDEVYCWDHGTHEMTKVVDDFDEICWGADPGEYDV